MKSLFIAYIEEHFSVESISGCTSQPRDQQLNTASQQTILNGLWSGSWSRPHLFIEKCVSACVSAWTSKVARKRHMQGDGEKYEQNFRLYVVIQKTVEENPYFSNSTWYTLHDIVLFCMTTSDKLLAMHIRALI